MSIVVRAIDVGFGNTKYVTASAQGQVACAHFPSLAYFSHDEVSGESMGGKRRTVQVPVDGLLYEVGPDVEFAADRFRSRQLHDAYAQTAEYRALATGALHFKKVDTVDLLVVGLPVSQYTAKRAALQKAMTGVFDAGRKQQVVKRALVVPQPQGALYWCAQQGARVNAGRKPGMVRMKLTISSEEHPAMFDALISIKNPRHRTGRLKDLVIKALTLEQVGATAATGPLLAAATRQEAPPGGEAARVGTPATSVTSMLEWENSET